MLNHYPGIFGGLQEGLLCHRHRRGQSGSAVYRMISGGRYEIVIHAYGGATANSGMRIVQPVYDNLLAWKA